MKIWIQLNKLRNKKWWNPDINTISICENITQRHSLLETLNPFMKQREPLLFCWSARIIRSSSLHGVERGRLLCQQRGMGMWKLGRSCNGTEQEIGPWAEWGRCAHWMSGKGFQTLVGVRMASLHGKHSPEWGSKALVRWAKPLRWERKQWKQCRLRKLKRNHQVICRGCERIGSNERLIDRKQGLDRMRKYSQVTRAKFPLLEEWKIIKRLRKTGVNDSVNWSWRCGIKSCFSIYVKGHRNKYYIYIYA